MRQVIAEVLKTCNIHFVIDALDEVTWGSQREELLRFMGELPGYAKEQLRVLVSSRNETDMQGAFSGSDSSWKDLPIALQHVDRDIKIYIDGGIEKHPSLRRQNEFTKSLIREKLINNASGLYTDKTC